MQAAFIRLTGEHRCWVGVRGYKPQAGASGAERRNDWLPERHFALAFV